MLREGAYRQPTATDAPSPWRTLLELVLLPFRLLGLLIDLLFLLLVMAVLLGIVGVMGWVILQMVFPG